MKKRLLSVTLLTAVALCFGIAAIVSPVEAKAKPVCTTTGCPPEVQYETICCSEWVPVNPNCRSPKMCDYEWVTTCWEEPCDEI